MVKSSSSCCKLSLHSRSASEISSSSLGDIEVVEPAEDDGSESTSSRVLARGMLAYEDDGSDMVEAVADVTRGTVIGRASRGVCDCSNDFAEATVKDGNRVSASIKRLRSSECSRCHV